MEGTCCCGGRIRESNHDVTTDFEYAELKRQRDELLVALNNIAEQLAEHPACMSADASFEDIESEGGDAAFMTYNLQNALASISKACG